MRLLSIRRRAMALLALAAGSIVVVAAVPPEELATLTPADFEAMARSTSEPAAPVELRVFTSNSFEDAFGVAVDGVGDINGDGFADVIVGASLDDASGDGCGIATVFSGFTMPGQSFASLGLVPGLSASLSWNAGASPESVTIQTEHLPEPVTGVLLAGGVLAVGMSRYARRRRETRARLGQRVPRDGSPRGRGAISLRASWSADPRS